MPPVRVRFRKKRAGSAKGMTAADLNSDGGDPEQSESQTLPEDRLTEQQKGELRACFDAFDEDNSGFLCAPIP